MISAVALPVTGPSVMPIIAWPATTSRPRPAAHRRLCPVQSQSPSVQSTSRRSFEVPACPERGGILTSVGNGFDEISNSSVNGLTPDPSRVPWSIGAAGKGRNGWQ
jgi:hypothetical protein